MFNMDRIESAISELTSTDITKGINIGKEAATEISVVIVKAFNEMFNELDISYKSVDEIANLIISSGNVPEEWSAKIATYDLMINITGAIKGIVNAFDKHPEWVDFDSKYAATHTYIELNSCVAALAMAYGIKGRSISNEFDIENRVAEAATTFVEEGHIWPGTELMMLITKLMAISAANK